MNKIIFLIAILLTYSAYASCTLDNIEACTANSQTSIPDLTPTKPPLLSPASANLFQDVPETVQSNREITPNNLRNFGTTGLDYGYNSSCQFGVCMETGTPKNFTNYQNKD